MKLIVGLGNPGTEYVETRHNVGFMVIDKLAQKLAVEINKSKNKALIGEGSLEGEKVLLVKPQTYMNLSGEAVGSLARWYKLKPEEVIVIYDDMDLTVGKLRIRPQGSSGGHNGMKSIIAHLGTENFPRLRIGIGRQGDGAINHVLGKFAPQDREMVDEIIVATVDALALLVKKGVESAMNRYNR